MISIESIGLYFGLDIFLKTTSMFDYLVGQGRLSKEKRRNIYLM